MASQLRTAAFVILVLSMADTFVYSMFDAGQTFRVMTGDTAAISGKLGGDIRLISDDLAKKITDPARLASLLDYAPRYPNLTLRFVELNGRLWRAQLHADNVRTAGDYPIRVFPAPLGLDTDAPPHVIRLFTDRHSLNGSFTSPSRRYLGIEPWWITLVMIPVTVYCFVLAFRKSTMEEAEMTAMGIGPIYKLAKKKGSWELIIGIGKAHGIRPGDSLVLLDRNRDQAGELVVTQVYGDHSHATAEAGTLIKPGYVARKKA